MREKEAYNNKRNIIYFAAAFFEVRVRIFFSSDNFQGTDFRFMFTQVLLMELALTLIYVRKTFNFRVSFKILLLMYLAIVEKEL